MPRPIGHEGDELFAPPTAGGHLVQQGADRFHDIEVGLLVAAAHAIGRPGSGAERDGQQCACMVVHIQPIADI